MSPDLLNLNISQLHIVFDKSKANKYADTRKQKYHKSLTDLFTIIQNEDIKTYDYPRQLRLKKVLDFIFYSIEFLDSSTLTNIPHEIVFCLEKALKEWDNSDSYIIVTSLQNNIFSYSFNPELALNPEYYDIILNDFSIEFESRLIQINLPRYLVHDYLANVVLYHELGHFIDRRYRITERLFSSKYNQHDIQSNPSLIQEYFHLGEYFSDIFAAQYIGKASNYYLNYIAHKNPNSNTHPSTENRLKFTEDFLNGVTSNTGLNALLNATFSTINIPLNIRYKAIDDADFKALIPPKINTDNELHSVFEVGWNLWNVELPEFTSKSITYQDKYRILNNLIEKSISNYMVIEKWNK